MVLSAQIGSIVPQR